MRVPLTRRRGDETPTSWWEWLFTPVIVAALLAMCVAACAYLTLYPERQAFAEDFGTDRQREMMDRFRRRAARVSVWRRLARALTLYLPRRSAVRQLRARRRSRASAGSRNRVT